MYVILVYDIASAAGGEKRLNKMLKLCRKYLNWIQNSVFEGELTELQLKELLLKAKKIMQSDTDSIILFKSREERWLDREVIGVERMPTSNFL